MRKAFNFFRSYYDVANELSDKDRLLFYDALLLKQFENIDIDLKGLAKFAYISQYHSISSQLKGYYDKTKDVKFIPTLPPTIGATEPPTLQEKEKVQEKVQEKEKEKVQVQDVKSYFLENGYSDLIAQKFYDYYSVANWKDSKGNKVKNWKQKAQAVWFKPENKIIDPNAPMKMVY